MKQFSQGRLEKADPHRLSAKERRGREAQAALALSGSFALALPNLMPIKGPVRIQVYDEDAGTFLDCDDLIVDMLWQPPYGGIRNTLSLDEADYDVRVRLNT